jgi:GNAT superfamily N-acetyltransferase
MRISVRRAEEKDHPSLARIFLEARKCTFTWQDATAFNLSDFEHETRGEILILAAGGNGTVLGFISVWEPESFVHHLFVDPLFQGRGIGTRLLESLREWLPPPHRLKCLLANPRAHLFYLRKGWTEIARSGIGTGAYAELVWPRPSSPESGSTTRQRGA